MSRYLKFSLIAALGVAMIFVGAGAVSAQGETPPSAPGWGPHGPHHGYGFGHGTGIMAEYADIMHEAVADLLGISESALEEAMGEGQSMFSLAAERGVDLDELREVMADARAEMLDSAVADGVISAERAEWMGEGMGAGKGGRNRGGMCDGFGAARNGPSGRNRR